MNNWKNKTILIAEDDMINFKLMDLMLKKTGANVIWAQNGSEAVKIANGQNVDAILMDIQMPVMDGTEATIKIRENNKEVPIVILSAYMKQDIEKIAGHTGLSGYLNKPVQADKLFGTIDKFFGPDNLAS